MKKVAVYVRCSTVNRGQDLDTQILPLKDFVKVRGWELYKVYEDSGESGAKENRKALKELMDDAQKRKFDCVVVFRFDRFARSSKMLIDSLETFGSLGIDFISYQENLDTTTPTGKVMFTIISAFAEFERAIICERVNAGIAKSKRKGMIFGRPRANLDMKKIMELKSTGLSVRKIAQQLKIPRSTIQDYLAIL